MKGEIGSLRTELKLVNEKLTSQIDDLDKCLDIVQHLTILEAKQREFEKKKSNS